MMMYIKEQIETILKEHKQNEGRLIEIDLKLEEYQKRLYYAGTVYEDTDQEIIENMQLRGQPFDNIHSNTNKISDKVPSTVLNYHKEKYHINKEDRLFLNSEINRLIIEKENTNKKVVRVKNWLDKIGTREATILEEFYINNLGKNWDKAVKAYNKREEKELTKRQLATIRDDGIKNILKIVNV